MMRYSSYSGKGSQFVGITGTSIVSVGSGFWEGEGGGGGTPQPTVL